VFLGPQEGGEMGPEKEGPGSAGEQFYFTLREGVEQGGAR
jgi:hypothetical protein